MTSWLSLTKGLMIGFLSDVISHMLLVGQISWEQVIASAVIGAVIGVMLKV
jgi:hypothetical protein